MLTSKRPMAEALPWSSCGLIKPGLRVLAVALFAMVWAGCNGSPNPQAASRSGGKRGMRGNMTVSVAVAKAERRDVPVYLQGLGSVEAFNTVVVKSRLDGQLVEIHFKEGQEVQKGDLLAVIDPRPYEVALHQSEATLFKDQAALSDAKLNFQRFQDLFKQGVIPQQQFDTQKSLMDQLEGAVRADQANIDNVKLNLAYTRITAPVSGRIGLRQVDIGNMVHASDPNGLLVITQLHPIAAVFTLPEDDLPTVAKHLRKGSLQVDAYSRDDQTKLATGKLLTIDNQIDPTTGTGKLKAVFDNTNRALWPNQFVNVHLLLEVEKNSLVVPAAAIQRGPQGTYVYTVKPDKTAEMKKVSVGLNEGNLTTLASGLQPGELVVTDGQDKLQPGSKVEIRAGQPQRPSGQQEAAAPGQ
ncbi:MAG TPA: MdtA/MuxA family multidrug efflux RND transporter periplasmic adaptor subunit [Candidatus Angelobacter sp.]|nr:MdtA/MuxA family multidrug efflux RND transporter periplasmic adaptor subunit [Candidatus Angelobacter sp.]